MFTVLSDLSLIFRKTYPVDLTSDVIVSGIQGTWMTQSGGKAVMTTGATALAFPVFDESYRNQTVGWVPEVTNNKKVTVLAGKGYFARTTQFVSTSIVENCFLATGANGKLVYAANNDAGNCVAICTVAPRNIDYLGNTVSAIDIYVF